MRCAGGCRHRFPLAQEPVHDLAVAVALKGRVGEVGQHPAADELLVGGVVRVEDPKQVRVRLGEALVRERLPAACQRDQREQRVRPERQEHRLGRADEPLGGLVRAHLDGRDRLCELSDDDVPDLAGFLRQPHALGLRQ